MGGRRSHASLVGEEAGGVKQAESNKWRSAACRRDEMEMEKRGKRGKREGGKKRRRGEGGGRRKEAGGRRQTAGEE